MKINLPDEVRALIKEGESQTLDFKLKLTDAPKVARTLAAFANTQGGRLLVGVSDQGQVTGVDPEEEKHMLQLAADRYCQPPVSLQFMELQTDGRVVLLAQVAESQVKPHFALDFEGRHYRCHREKDKNVCVLTAKNQL
ncbi:MAG: ATP-binding protein [Bernardetiaceae bacterium]|nr:ATP-binding protein [Bernardetiaceae bacterium]